MMFYYITKYAFTKGILKVRAPELNATYPRLSEDGRYLYFKIEPSGLSIQVPSTDFFTTLEAAELRVAQLHERKLRQLEARLNKLKAYRPKVVEI